MHKSDPVILYILPIVMSETVCYTYYRVKEREVIIMANMMTDRMYVIDGSREMNRRDFEHYLFELITENELFGDDRMQYFQNSGTKTGKNVHFYPRERACIRFQIVVLYNSIIELNRYCTWKLAPCSMICWRNMK